MENKTRKWMMLLAAALLLACLLLPFCWGKAVQTFSPRGSQVELAVIMYHSLVESDSRASEYVCPVSRVESDLQWLTERGYESVTLAQLIAFADGEGTLPAKPVLITLDDGYRNNLTLLPPLLERYDAHAVIALVGEYADVYTACGDDGSLHAGMSWEDAAQAAASPRLELAGHSYYFHHLAGRKGAARKKGESLSDWKAALTSDTLSLQETMLERCGVTPLAYAYPFGRISEGADGVLQELGFRVTLSCREIRSQLTSGDAGCLYSLGRFNRDGRLSTADFMAKLFREK